MQDTALLPEGYERLLEATTNRSPPLRYITSLSNRRTSKKAVISANHRQTHRGITEYVCSRIPLREEELPLPGVTVSDELPSQPMISILIISSHCGSRLLYSALLKQNFALDVLSIRVSSHLNKENTSRS
jgi:hypothetical protein